MNIEVRNKPLSFTLYGLSGKVDHQNYGKTGQQLMDVLWKEIGAQKLKHKGKNHWVYEEGDILFTGVELDETPNYETNLVRKEMVLRKHVYCKHIGPYHLLSRVHTDIRAELKNRNLQPCYPSIEIYGHWTEDESKLETDILIAIN